MERIGLAPGTEIGGYRVLAPLGSGGMGTVYRAVDADGVTVALKLLHPHLTADPDARARLAREVANLRKVRHPGVARVLDAEIDSTEAFVVTELVPGTDLATRVRERGPLPGPELVELAEGLRSALARVHALGVLHRDLTPGNVMIPGPVLIDFGIAQDATDERVTSVGLVAGTPGYLAPEVLDGAEPSAAADWWGWAAVVAFAATGRQPFGPGPTPALLARVRAGEPDLEGLPAGTAAALAAALARDPAQRATPEEVVARLRDPEAPVATKVLAAGDVPATRALPVGGGDAAAEDPVSGGADDDVDGYDETDEYGETDGYDETDGHHDEDRFADDAGTWDHRPSAEFTTVVGAGPPVDPGAWEPPEPRRRIGSTAAVGAALVALGTTRPAIALAVAVGLAVLVRSVGHSVDSYHRHRHERGERRGDAVRATLAWPWAFLRGAIGVVPSALVALSVVVIVGGVGWWLLDTGRLTVAAPAPGESAGEIAGQAAWVTPALLAVAVAAGLLTLWFGPTARTTRVGGRWALAALAPGRAGALLVVVLALALAGVLVTLTVLGLDTAQTQWWPLPGPPDLR